MNKEDKELDLFELISRLYNFLKDSVKFLIDEFLQFLRFNIKSILYIIFFAAFAVGVSFYLIDDDNIPLNGDFLIEVNGAKSSAVADIVNVLAQSIDKDGNSRFAKELNLNASEVKNIRALKTFSVIDRNNNRTRDYVDYDNSFIEDTLNSRMENYLCIRIEAKGPVNFSKFQAKIVDYLRSDEYLKREEKERTKIITERIFAIDHEILTLEQLRMSQTNNEKLAFIDKGIVKETTYYNDMISLKAQKSSLQEQLNLQPHVVTVYSGVKISSDRVDYKIFAYLLIASYFLALIVSFLVRFRKKIYKVLVKS